MYIYSNINVNIGVFIERNRSFRDHLFFDENVKMNRSKVKLAGIVACVQNNVFVLNNNTLNKRAAPS